MTTFTEFVTLARINCGKCGGTYAINETYRAEKETVGGWWHCPYCECSWGYGVSENGRLKRELEEKERLLRQEKCEALRNQQLLDAERLAHGAALRKIRRVSRGVCPCCNRTFENLARHMATKHKDQP